MKTEGRSTCLSASDGNANCLSVRASASDSKSTRRSHVGWITIDNIQIPYVLRNEKKYVSAKMVEAKLLSAFPDEYPPELQSVPEFASYNLTTEEASFLNAACELDARFTENQHAIHLSENDEIISLDEFVLFYDKLKSVSSAEGNKNLDNLEKMANGFLLHCSDHKNVVGGWMQINGFFIPFIIRSKVIFLPVDILHNVMVIPEIYLQSYELTSEKEHKKFVDLGRGLISFPPRALDMRIISLKVLKQQYPLHLGCVHCPANYNNEALIAFQQQSKKYSAINSMQTATTVLSPVLSENLSQHQVSTNINCNQTIPVGLPSLCSNNNYDVAAYLQGMNNAKQTTAPFSSQSSYNRRELPGYFNATAALNQQEVASVPFACNQQQVPCWTRVSQNSVGNLGCNVSNVTAYQQSLSLSSNPTAELEQSLNYVHNRCYYKNCDKFMPNNAPVNYSQTTCEGSEIVPRMNNYIRRQDQTRFNPYQRESPFIKRHATELRSSARALDIVNVEKKTVNASDYNQFKLQHCLSEEKLDSLEMRLLTDGVAIVSNSGPISTPSVTTRPFIDGPICDQNRLNMKQNDFHNRNNTFGNESFGHVNMTGVRNLSYNPCFSKHKFSVL